MQFSLADRMTGAGLPAWTYLSAPTHIALARRGAAGAPPVGLRHIHGVYGVVGAVDETCTPTVLRSSMGNMNMGKRRSADGTPDQAQALVWATVVVDPSAEYKVSATACLFFLHCAPARYSSIRHLVLSLLCALRFAAFFSRRTIVAQIEYVLRGCSRVGHALTLCAVATLHFTFCRTVVASCRMLLAVLLPCVSRSLAPHSSPVTHSRRLPRSTHPTASSLPFSPLAATRQESPHPSTPHQCAAPQHPVVWMTPHLSLTVGQVIPVQHK
jgi:hypothetical protein